MQRILVVCVGNICRSPTAEILLRHRLPGLTVGSAGLAALSGQPMDRTARAVLLEHGLDGSRHRARQLHDGMLRDADLVLGMEQRHVQAMRQDLPEAPERMALLSQWSGGADVPDPFRRSRTEFERVFAMIHTAVEAWVPHLGTR